MRSCPAKIIHADVENLLLNLQFQDRVSQIISVIDSDIQRLQDTVQNEQPIPPANEWLSELKVLYTMHEQHQVHATTAATTGSKAGAGSADAVVFF